MQCISGQIFAVAQEQLSFMLESMEVHLTPEQEARRIYTFNTDDFEVFPELEVVTP